MSTRCARCNTLSVGERQRVEIVRSLMTNPKLLIPRRAHVGAHAPAVSTTLFVTLRQLDTLAFADRQRVHRAQRVDIEAVALGDLGECVG